MYIYIYIRTPDRFLNSGMLGSLGDDWAAGDGIGLYELLGLHIAQNRSHSYTLGPEVGILLLMV